MTREPTLDSPPTVSTPPGPLQAESQSDFPFERLDFLYMPSRDVAADGAYFTDILGGRIVFSVEAMGTRVSMIDLTAHPSHRPSRGRATHLDLQGP